MRWIRVKFHDIGKLVLPDVCPNCLLPGADSLVPIVYSTGFPFIVSTTRSAQWPFCPRCAQAFTRHTRQKRWFAIVPASLLALLALIVAASPNGPGVISVSAFLLLLAAVFVGVVGCSVLTMVQRNAPKPDSCISNFPAVRPVKGGTSFLGKRSYATFDFCHPIYVELLLELNDYETVKVSERDFEKARIAYRAQNLRV